MSVSLSTLLTEHTEADFLAQGLALAAAEGLPTTSWRVGDPTRTLFAFLAEVLANHDEVTRTFINSAYLDTAEADWLDLLAEQQYGVTRIAGTYASSTLTLHNSGGGYYPKAAGELTFASSSTGKTYHSTSAISIQGEGDYTVTVEADEPGSEYAAGLNEIDTIVTTMLGVAVTGSTIALAQDRESDLELRARCRLSLGALSPNGPGDAYEYVALTPSLSGTTAIARAASAPQLSSGEYRGYVDVYVASASGEVAPEDVALVQAAVEQWAAPLCVHPVVASVTMDPIVVTATVWGDGLPSSTEDIALTSLAEEMAALPLRRDVEGEVRGPYLATSAIVAAIHNALVEQGASNVRVVLAAPALDVDCDFGEAPEVDVSSTITIGT